MDRGVYHSVSKKMLKMHLVFATQEIGKAPSGVITVLTELCRYWPEADRITVLMNPAHWVESYLANKLKGKANIHFQRIPSFASRDWLRLRLTPFPARLRILIRFMLIPVTGIQSLLMLGWLIVWLRRKQVAGILSHNGGWPGGELNRLVIVAAWLVRIPQRYLVIHNTPWIPPKLLGSCYRLYGGFINYISTKVITVSEDCRKRLEAVGGFKEVKVIYNGISVTENDEGEKDCIDVDNDSPPWPKKLPTIGFVGEIHPRKGVHILIDAMKQVDIPCELVLVGSGDSEYTQYVSKMAKTLNCSVYFLGFREDAKRLYQWMDVVVLPSIKYESFGMVLLEAMRAGKPVICSDFGGMKEVVVDRKTGFIVPAGDAHSLAMVIKYLLSNRKLREQMGLEGRYLLENRFNTVRMVRNYIKLFH